VILTCPGCAARFVIPRSADELRDMEVTHPACGHAFAPFADVSAMAIEIEAPSPEPLAASTALVLYEAPTFVAEVEGEACDDDGLFDDGDDDEDEDEASPHIDTDRLRMELTQATTIPFRQLIPKLTAAGFASAAAAELVFLFHNGIDAAFPATHFTLALLGMGR
jgi:hypothetical protein